MKKIITISLLLVFAINVFGQGGGLGSSAYMGISFSGSNTWLLNKWVFDKGDEQDIAASFGYNVGLNGGYYFNDDVGFEIDVLYNAHNMKYEGRFGPTGLLEYTSETKLTYTDIPILFKAGSESYLEIGPVFSLLSKADYNYKTSTNDNTIDVKDKFTNSSINILIGFGTNFEASDHIIIKAGLRFMYGFTDIEGVDALGKSKTDYPVTSTGLKDFKTNLASGALHIGLIYKF